LPAEAGRVQGLGFRTNLTLGIEVFLTKFQKTEIETKGIKEIGGF
jgi:hypothetical protein